MAGSWVAVRFLIRTHLVENPLTLGRPIKIKIVCELAEPHTALARSARDLHPVKSNHVSRLRWSMVTEKTSIIAKYLDHCTIHKQLHRACFSPASKISNETSEYNTNKPQQAL
jgi:hypothetical protein